MQLPLKKCMKIFKDHFDFILILLIGKFETCLIEVSNKMPWMLHWDGDKASLDKVNNAETSDIKNHS